jgi:hypothetical protein
MSRDAVLEADIQDEPAALPAPDETILRMRSAILGGQHWFEAVLDAVGRWRLPEEQIADRELCYLIGGEAFDWLLLAERLVDEALDLIPAGEAEALLFEGRWPVELSDEEFAARLGHAKHSAHLNYLYGVLVESALQLAVEEEIHKESRSRVWGQDTRVDETMFQRVYAKPREELFAQYYEETRAKIRGDVAYADWQAFTYWLFKLRLRRQDKARIASDTRKGLAQLTRMELAVSHRRHGAPLNEEAFESRYVS